MNSLLLHPACRNPGLGLGLLCLTPFSTIFQLYLGGQFNLIYPQNIYLTFHMSRTNYQVYLTANGSRTDKPPF